jgi:hypothetical protein
MKQLDELGFPSVWIGYSGKVPERLYSEQMKELARDDVFNNYVVSMMVNKIGNNYGLVVQNTLSCITCIVQDIVPKNIAVSNLHILNSFIISVYFIPKIMHWPCRLLDIEVVLLQLCRNVIEFLTRRIKFKK